MTGLDLVEDLARRGFVDLVEVGHGGFAVVYRALQQEYGRTVALKVLSGGVLNETSFERFNRELRAMGLLSNHPNIVTVYSAGVTQRGWAYFVMEYVSRGSFADRILRSGPLPWEQVAEIGVKLAAALETSHRLGVLHRDVKPENVLLSPFGEPLLGDFGIAQVTGALVTSSNVQKLTIAHAPPEVFDGERQSAQADIYSLASTLMTLVLGHPPFVRDDDESVLPLYARISRSPPPDLRELGVPPRLCEVLERALAKDPAQRQASAFDFGQELRAAQRACGLPPTPMPIGADDEEHPAAPGGLARPPADVATRSSVTDVSDGRLGQEPAAAALSAARLASEAPAASYRGPAPRSVAPAAPPPATPPPPPPAPRPADRRSGRAAALLGVLGAGALAVTAFFVLRSDGTPVPVPNDGLAVGEDVWVIAGAEDDAGLMRLDVRTGDLLGGPANDFPLGGLRAVAEGAAADGSPVWGLNFAAHEISRELATGSETDDFAGAAEAIELDGGLVWVAHVIDGAVRVSISSSDGNELSGADAGQRPSDGPGVSLDVQAGVGWVAAGTNQVTRIGADGQTSPVFLDERSEQRALAVAANGDGALVVTDRGEVLRVMPGSGAAQPGGATSFVEAEALVVAEGKALDQVVANDEAVWVAGPGTGVWRVPPGLDGTPEQLDIPAGGPKVLALGTTGLWVADPDRGRLHHVRADGSLAEPVDLASLLETGG